MHFDDLGWGGFMTVAGMGTVFFLLAILMVILMLIGVFDRATVAAEERKAITAERKAAAADIPATSVQPELEPAPLPPGLEILHDGLTRDQIAAVALAVTTHARVRRAQAAPAMRSHQPGSHLYASRWVSVGRGQQNSSWRRN